MMMSASLVEPTCPRYVAARPDSGMGASRRTAAASGSRLGEDEDAAAAEEGDGIRL